jgi:hypothetical protein
VSLENTDEPEETLTEEDLAILAAMRTMWETADPLPSGLVERSGFGLDLDDVDCEVSRPVQPLAPAMARSDELTRIVTFESDSLTIMIMFEQCVDGTTRIDGWLTPGACRRIELRCPAGPLSTDSDDTGRFSLAAVAPGPVRLVVHDAATSHRVITPTIEI